MTPTGPRIIVKRDTESSIGRGAALYLDHFRPHVSVMIWAIARACPDSCTELWITEGHRKIRDTRDLHEECLALDFTFRDGEQRLIEVELHEIAREARSTLGDEYDLIAHGSGSNLHIHAEYDPKS